MAEGEAKALLRLLTARARPIGDTVRHYHVASRDPVAAIGRHDPPRGARIPAYRGDRGVEQGKRVQVEVPGQVARVPEDLVPVPDAPDVAGLVDDADPLQALLPQVDRGEQPAEPGPDHERIDLVGDGIPLGHLGVRVLEHLRMPA